MYSTPDATLSQRAITLKEMINKEIGELPWHVKATVGESLLALSYLGDLVADLAEAIDSGKK